MSTKFTRASNQYLSVPDKAALTFPRDVVWSQAFIVVFDGVTSGDNTQYLVSTGSLSSSGSYNVVYYTATSSFFPNKIAVYCHTAPGESPSVLSSATFPAGAYLFVVQHGADNVMSMRHCPILATQPTDGSAVVTSTSTNAVGVLDGASGLFIGNRADLPGTRNLDQSLDRVFYYQGALTDLEVANLAYGKEITDLGKTPGWYFRLDTPTDITDRGTQGNVATANGTLTTGTAPGFGYTASTTPTAPTISGMPVIVGGAVVGSASSVSPASASGYPAPTLTYQWKLDGVAVSGATGTTYTPVAGDVGKVLTVTETATNSTSPAANSTSNGVTVTSAATTVDVTQLTAERIYQRSGTSLSIPLSGTYTGTAPASIEYQLYAENGTDILAPWVAIPSPTIGSGAWSGTPLVPQGGMYRLCVRSKDSGGAVLATSNIKVNLFGVGDLIGVIGSSSPQYYFTNFSGGGYAPAANTRTNAGGGWSRMGTDGVAVTMASSLASQLGVPIGMFNYGVGGTTLADQLNTSGSLWTNFVNAVNAAGGKLKGVIASSGSNDANNGNVASRASHLANLRQWVTNIRSFTGQSTLPVLLAGFNRRLATADVQADFVRMAENDIGDDANVYAVQTVDFELVDGTHMTPAGFRGCAARIQSVFGQVLTGGTYRRGPKITSIVASGSNVVVTIAHRNGTDFTPTSALNGFTISDESTSGTAPIINSVVRTSSTQITITCSRALVNPTIKYLSGGAPVSQTQAAPANEVFDNGSLALPMTVETVMGTPTTTPPNLVLSNPVFGAGKFGSALVGGSASTSAYPSTNTFTFEAWFKTSNVGPMALFSVSGNFVGVDGSGKLYGWIVGSSGPVVNDGAWHHVAYCGDASGSAAYLDGVLVVTNGAGPIAASGLIFTIGRHQSQPNFQFIGAIDEFSTWSIKKYSANFTPPAAPYTSGTSGLSTVYHFEGTGLEGATASAPTGDTPAPSTVSSVTVNPSTATLSGGGTVDFDWVINGSNNPSQGATVTTTLGTINSAGLLTAPAATSSVQNGIVTVTSSQDSTKSGTASFTVNAAVAPPPASTVTGVTVTPPSAYVVGGGTVDFDWVVIGTNNPSQGATVSTTLGTIDANGVLTAPASTSVVQNGTVTVTSTQNTAVSGIAIFSVTPVSTAPLPTPSASPVIALYSPMFVPKNTAPATPAPFWPVKLADQPLPPGVANVGEYGFALSAGVGYNLSANIALGFKITRPDGTIIMRTSPSVTIGTSALVADFGTFAANEYAVYMVQDGDFTIPGVYVARVIYTDANKRLVSEPAGFVVNA